MFEIMLQNAFDIEFRLQKHMKKNITVIRVIPDKITYPRFLSHSDA